jgi:hypothetical protein
MKLIFLYGLPATGKLTVGKELTVITGYKLFHNHLAVDLLLSVFEFGSPQFVELREKIWLSVFESAVTAGLSGLIFTFAPETTVRPEFIDRAIHTIQSHGNGAENEILFVELTCPLSDLKSRIESPSRAQYQKLASVALFEQLHSAGVFDSSYMPQPVLSIDTSQVTPATAAATIAHELNLA